MTADEQVAPTMPAPPAHLHKVCSCGRVHDAFAWLRLHYVGVMRDDSVGAIELRNCDGCDSTIAVEIVQ